MNILPTHDEYMHALQHTRRQRRQRWWFFVTLLISWYLMYTSEQKLQLLHARWCLFVFFFVLGMTFYSNLTMTYALTGFFLPPRYFPLAWTIIENGGGGSHFLAFIHLNWSPWQYFMHRLTLHMGTFMRNERLQAMRGRMSASCAQDIYDFCHWTPLHSYPGAVSQLPPRRSRSHRHQYTNWNDFIITNQINTQQSRL